VLTSRSVCVESTLRRVVPAAVRICVRPIDRADLGRLSSRERDVVARSVPSRQASFATGRRVLKKLLDHDGEILPSESGAPLLPAGWRASLAHDDEFAVGIATRSRSIRALGVDIEHDRDLEEPVIPLILREDDVVPGVISAFVAKEATYKAWSTLGGAMLEHHDVRVEVHDDHFTARVGTRFRLDGRLLSVLDRRLAIAIVGDLPTT
jgi:4'-phosphopantetheinyl transferase EntD